LRVIQSGRGRGLAVWVWRVVAMAFPARLASTLGRATEREARPGSLRILLNP